MTPAQSPRLRTLCLLLLAPLLVAATPSPLPLADGLVLAQATRPERLVFVDPPREFLLNSCVPIIVETQNADSLPVLLGFTLFVTVTKSPALGSFHSSDTCQSPTSTVLIPSHSSRERVWFQATSLGRVTLEVNDGPEDLIDGLSRPIAVVPFLTERLQFTQVPQRAPVGTPVPIQVTAFDDRGAEALGYAGRVRLSSTPPISGLPLDATFDPTLDSGKKTFHVTFPVVGTYVLRIQDLDNADLVAESPAITVHGPKVSMYASPQSPVPACERVRLDLTVVSPTTGQPVDGLATVRVCRPETLSATVDDHGFQLATEEGGCITGTFYRSTSVFWTNTRAEDVTFTLYETEVQVSVPVSWRHMLSPALSSFSFRENDTSIPTLASFNEQLTLELNLRDTCGNPLVFPSGKELAFSATAPLVVGPAVQENSGRWTAPVGLMGCPSDLTKPLAVWPTLDGTPLPRAPGERFEQFVQPKCSEPFVELVIRPGTEGGAAEPGGRVEFEVKLENKGPQPIDDGVLHLSAEGMTLLEVKIDGQRTAPPETGIVLPHLGTGQQLKVTVIAQATTNRDQAVRVTAWYTTLDGAPLTPQKDAHFNLGNLGVDVGCGCHASTLPGQLLPWLALLLAASRPWERSRRLRRRERIDR
jgi:hypothetical protein